MSVHEAARQTRHMFGSDGISESRWRQIEHGIRWFRGTPHPETGPAQTIARMALVVGGTPGQFREIGCDEIAAEMEALAPVVRAALTGRQLRGLARRSHRDASDELCSGKQMCVVVRKPAVTGGRHSC